jgi:glucosyl-dolichyl phosphate glucuronosyltransferase
MKTHGAPAKNITTKECGHKQRRNVSIRANSTDLARTPPRRERQVAGRLMKSLHDMTQPSVITVCICTYNRSESLRRTLDSLARQNNTNLDTIEVLVVDNNCSDDTMDVVQTFRERLPIRRVTENRQGLAHARNRAVAEFRGGLLLFTDDDVRLGPGWLAAYQDAICRFPSADYFGGRILPDWGQAKPRWISGEPLSLIDGVLVWFDRGSETRPFLATDPPPFGANFAVRRSLFEKIGRFRVDLGTGGLGLGRGEETEFVLRARETGAHGLYVGEALCFHSYDPQRLRLRQLYYYGISSGKSHNAIFALPDRGSYWTAGLFLLRGLHQAAKGRGDRFRQCIINAGIQVGTRPRRIAGYRI